MTEQEAVLMLAAIVAFIVGLLMGFSIRDYKIKWAESCIETDRERLNLDRIRFGDEKREFFEHMEKLIAPAVVYREFDKHCGSLISQGLAQQAREQEK
jgi:hypothetical protein